MVALVNQYIFGSFQPLPFLPVIQTHYHLQLLQVFQAVAVAVASGRAQVAAFLVVAGPAAAGVAAAGVAAAGVVAAGVGCVVDNELTFMKVAACFADA
jgi:hypothetical protein